MTVTFWVNGRKQAWEVLPDEVLADSLRGHGFISVKKGCGQGACGLCTVWVEEKPVPSCSVLPVRMEGKQITTLEGVQEEAAAYGRLLVEEGADQCGFCAPGLTMLVLAMKKELVDPSEQQVREYLNGNLCRCSGYYGQIRAAMHYLQSERLG